MKLIKLRRGDRAFIAFPATLNGETLDIDYVAEAEFVMGSLTWHWPENCVYDKGLFLLPVTQAQSFALTPGTILPVEGRIRLDDDQVWVKGAEIDVYVHVSESGGEKVFESEVSE